MLIANLQTQIKSDVYVKFKLCFNLTNTMSLIFKLKFLLEILH